MDRKWFREVKCKTMWEEHAVKKKQISYMPRYEV